MFKALIRLIIVNFRTFIYGFELIVFEGKQITNTALTVEDTAKDRELISFTESVERIYTDEEVCGE